MVPPFTAQLPALCRPPTDHSGGDVLSYRRKGLGEEAPNIAYTSKTLTIAFTTVQARTS